MTLDTFFWFLILCVLILSLVSFFWWIAPWVPTRNKDLKRINKLAKLKKGQTFYELGCGDGRVCTYIAQKNPKNQVIGYEIFLPVYLIAKIRSLPYPNLTVRWQNLFWEKLTDADVVYVFGMIESLNEPLKEKFLTELKPGSRIISYVFSMKEWSGKKETHQKSKNDKKINVYTV